MSPFIFLQVGCRTKTSLQHIVVFNFYHILYFVEFFLIPQLLVFGAEMPIFIRKSARIVRAKAWCPSLKLLFFPSFIIRPFIKESKSKNAQEILFFHTFFQQNSNQLFNIPFRYECALTLGNTTVYPDFTIMHPNTGELIYREHLE